MPPQLTSQGRKEKKTVPIMIQGWPSIALFPPKLSIDPNPISQNACTASLV